jgi:hypothetical protein
MITKKNFIVIMFLALICASSSACARNAVVRKTALQLRVAVIEDEKLVDKNIAEQKQFYEKQRTTIENARTLNIPLSVDAFRRSRSAHAATSLSLNPDKEARLANLMDYLQETHDQEYDLWEQLYGGDQQAREELKSRIAKLERQKKLLEQVKNNLNQLALEPSSKKRAQTLLKFSQEAYTAYKQTGQ